MRCPVFCNLDENTKVEIGKRISNLFGDIYKVVDNNFVIRRIGKKLVLRFLYDDIFDWWDISIDKYFFKKVFHYPFYSMTFKWVFKNSNIATFMINEGFRPSSKEEKNYYLDLSKFDSPEDYLRYLSYNRRRIIKKSYNKARKEGNVKVGLYPFDLHNDFELMRRMIVERYPNSLWKSNLYSDIMKLMIRDFKRSNKLDTWKIYIGNEIASYSLIIKEKNVAYWWITTLNSKFKHVGIGNFFLWKIIEYYIQEGFEEFNFMKGSSDYKRHWTHSFRVLIRFDVNNPRLFSRIKSLFYLSTILIKKSLLSKESK